VLTDQSVMRDGRECVTLDAWRNAAVVSGLLDADKPDSARAIFSKLRAELVAGNVVGCDTDFAWQL